MPPWEEGPECVETDKVISGALYVCLGLPCGSVWVWSSFTLRSQPGLAALCPALNQLLKIMKPQDRLNQSLTHTSNENRGARNCAAVQQAPKFRTGNGADCRDAGPLSLWPGITNKCPAIINAYENKSQTKCMPVICFCDNPWMCAVLTLT
jgi:hypothetical protein